MKEGASRGWQLYLKDVIFATAATDFRLISMLPILSRMVRRLVARAYLNPAMTDPHFLPNIEDQCAFRPTGSAMAALIEQLTEMPHRNNYVMLVSMDFSRVFDSRNSKPTYLQKPMISDHCGTCVIF